MEKPQAKNLTVASLRTRPDWEAHARYVPQNAPAGPPSRVHLTLTALGRRADGVQAFATVEISVTPEEARAHARHIAATADDAEAFDKWQNENQGD